MRCNLHESEVMDKTILSSAFQKKNQYKSARAEAGLCYSPCRRVVIIGMTPDEVINKLKELGVNISKSTLRNYEKWGLIPLAKHGSAGRGKGRTTDYPKETVAEAYASAKLINRHNTLRLSPSNVARCRVMAKKRKHDFFSLIWLSINLLISNGYVEAEKNSIIVFYQERGNVDELKKNLNNIIIDYYQKSEADVNLNDEDYLTGYIDAEISQHILCKRNGDCPKEKSEYAECLKNCIFKVYEIREISYMLLDKKKVIVFVREENTGHWREKQRFDLI